MSEPMRAIFLSYASKDAEAARRICESLRASGLEVWFDQSELRGGDVWDQTIRQQIHDCSLFMPIISAHTDERSEGYFRLEWKLAVDRSHLMADDAPFLLPVVIDDSPEATARVPEKFRAVQWTRLPDGAAPPEFCRRVGALLAGSTKPHRAQAYTPATSDRRGASARWLAIAAIALVLIATAALLAWRTMTRAPRGPVTAQSAAIAPASVIPEHSIAVLAFEDVSARKDQEYFSDGLAEALLNLLSKVPGMQVAARTSAFSFKGHAVDVPTIGRQLRVANVLEGSVRRVGNHLRVTAQLERADNGYQIWSETYDRELGDVFRIQDEIANAVVKALKVSLLGATAPRTQGTQNSDAYLVFLQGRAKMATQRLADSREAAADFGRAIKLDPNYGPSYVELATAKLQLAEFEITGDRQAAFGSAINEGKLLIEKALALDPNDAQAYVERGYLRAFSDLAGAEQDYRRGIQLNPNSARGYEGLAGVLFEDPPRRDEALAMIGRAQRLDPLEPKYDVLKALFLLLGRGNLRDAGAVLMEVVARYPLYPPGLERLGFVRRGEGNYADAIMYSERALKLDPLADWTRRLLILDYSDIGEQAAATQIADQSPHPLPIHRLNLLIAERNWRRAAEVSYAAIADGTMTPASEPEAAFSLRMDAHRSHDFGRARVVFERMCGVTWSPSGIPALPPQMGFAYASVALADMLINSGARDRGESLLRASLADIDHVAHDLRRGEFWYVIDKATAFALLGDRKAALAALHKAVTSGYMSTWSLTEMDPAFDALRADPEFQSLMRVIKAKIAHERQILAQMQADGRVPDRSAAAAAKP
jgi:TolB-like protein/Tfp pilus assembly protein PilF